MSGPPRYTLHFRPHNPRKARPMVRAMFEEMNRQRMTVPYLAHVTGISVSTINDWQRRNTPRWDALEKCLAVLGLEITLTRRNP